MLEQNSTNAAMQSTRAPATRQGQLYAMVAHNAASNSQPLSQGMFSLELLLHIEQKRVANKTPVLPDQTAVRCLEHALLLSTCWGQ